MRAIPAVVVLLVSLTAAGCSFSLLPPLNLPAEHAEVQFADRAKTLNPGNAHAWFIFGKEKLQDGQNVEARRAFERALSLQPSLIEAHLGVGRSYLQERNFARAGSTYEEILHDNPASVGAWEGLAEAHLGNGRLQEAEQAARSAVERAPRSHTGHLVLGQVDYIRGNYPDAVSHWREAERSGVLPREILPVLTDLEQYLRKYGSN